MSDEHFSLTPSIPPPATEADYEAIAAAVMETVRGRWFLTDYARRNRNADTELILKGLERIERLVRERPPAVAPAERVRIDLLEMAKAIAQTRSEIAAIKPDGDAKGTLSEATEELDSIVQTTERATSDILAAAERVQEIAWTLRERGAAGDICDSLDQRATDIYSACSFQDLTGQRTRKVVDVLRFLEDRIRAMIEIWGGAVPAPAAVTTPHVGDDRNVPHLAQGEIDRIMPSPLSDAPAARPNGNDAAAYHAGGDRTFTAPAAGSEAVAADIAASAAGGPATPEAVIAETAMPPGAVVLGATAPALDFAAIEAAREPEPEPHTELEARAEPQPEPEVRAEPQPEVRAEPPPEAEARAGSAPELAARVEPETQAELQRQPEAEPEPEPQPEPAVALETQSEAAQPALKPIAEPEVDVACEPRPDPAAVLKRILAIIRAPSDLSAEPAAADTVPPEVEAALAAAAQARPAAEAPAAPVAFAAALAAPMAADAVVTDVLAPEATAVDVAGLPDAYPEGGVFEAEEAAAAPAPLPAVGDAAADEAMPFAGPLTVDQAVDEMLLRSRPQAPPTAAEAVPSEPVAAIEPITPELPEWPAPAAEPVTEEPQPAAAVSPIPPVEIEMPELTVAPASEPVAEPEFVSQPEPFPQPAPAVAEPAAPAPQTFLPEALPEVAAAAALPRVAVIALTPADEAPATPVAPAAAPMAAPEPAVAAEPPAPVAIAPAPAAARPRPPPAPRHEALAVITALSDDEKIALFS
jgi:hypothetical protein